MVTVRDRLARRNAGGPEFKYIPQRIVVEVGNGLSVSDIASESDEFAGHMLDTPPVGEEVMTRVENKLQEIDFNTRRLENTGTIIAEADRLATVIENIKSQASEFSDKAINNIEDLEKKAKNAGNFTILDGFRPGMFNFQSADDRDFEAKLRNKLLDDLHNPITDAIEEVGNVVSVELSHTVNTPGPKNLGVDPYSDDRIPNPIDDNTANLADVSKKIGAQSAWDISTGENAVVAIFDTSFSDGFIDPDSERIIDTFYGEDVDSAFSAPEEGHGTMTAYSAAGNSDENETVDYSGIAKDADLLLARLSNASGSLVYTEEAWDWLASWIKSLDRPVISNHSYGVPLCAGRGQGLCSSIVSNISEALSKRDDHQAFYAAGNEADYCGKRLSGITNGIAGINSKEASMTVGAFRFDLNDAQSYSSHGFGTCTSIETNPKPDVGCIIPDIIPYGDQEKNMENDLGGSSAGTSEASPITAGVAALVSSVTGNAKRSEIENILEATAELPRRTQVNTILGYDARFGNGQVRANSAVKQAKVFEDERPPSAAFTYEPATPTVGEEVTFDASGSTDENEDIESYEWSFGDGSTATGEMVTHTFEEHGSVTVVLTVTDSVDQQDQFSSELNINGKPRASFNLSSDDILESETVTVDATPSTDPDGDIESYEWSFDDGTVADGQEIEHSYDESGSYGITLTVEDSLGNTDAETQTVSVTAAPTPRFTYEPETPVVGQSVTFDATDSTDPNGDIESYEWQFGDGTVSAGTVVNHIYDGFGDFNVILTVEDSAGNVRTRAQTVNVQAAPEPEFSYNPESPLKTESITFDASGSFDPDNSIASYVWDMGDGTTLNGKVVQHSYDSVGEYDVELTTEDSTENTSSTDDTLVVTAKPESSFTYQPDSPVAGESVQFDASDTIDADGDITSYEWNFGDGSSSEGVNVEKVYTGSGVFTVQLTVTDAQGNTSTSTSQIEIHSTPEAQFTYDPSSPTTSDAVTLDASTSVDEYDGISSYTWDIDGKETKQGQSVTVMFDESGEYSVTLTVEDTEGNTSVSTRIIPVSETTGDSTNQEGSE